MSEWKEVPAWEALKASQENTHDVQYMTSSTNSGWAPVGDHFVAGDNLKHRIRPKARTVDVIGLPVPKGIHGPFVLSGEWYIKSYFSTGAEARRAYEALCAASK